MFHRFFEEGLAQASYLLACDRGHEAVVVDPRRDVDVYVAMARQHGLTIVAAIETHIHADFVSGARELAAAGARIFAGPCSDLRFEHHEVGDKEQLPIGSMTLEFLHTPGHTPEHVSVLATQPGDETRVFTGDTLFVGAVGRPDLLGPDQMRALAGQLYDSLTMQLMALDDAVEVHPGHGAGSLCGAHIGSAPYSTIGRERSTNSMLQQPSREAFMAAVLADLPETPPYFARMKRINREGPVLVGMAEGYPGVRAIGAPSAQAAIEDGAILIDLRDAGAFCAFHPTGALNIAFGPKVGYWAGWVLPAGARIVLLASNPGEAAEAGRQLMRVGIDGVMGCVSGGASAWQAAGLPASHIPRVSARDLDERIRGGREAISVVDVRSAAEWAAGHLAGSLNLPIGDLVNNMAHVPREGTVATICESGYRSALAASILARAGISTVINVAGGMTEIRRVPTRG
jgi:hydroxyacylglutathione hydrolase